MLAAFREGAAGLGFSPALFLLALTAAGRRRLLGCLLSDAEPFSRRCALERGFLGLSRTHARVGALSRALLAVRLRMNAELVPIGLGQIDVVIARGLLDIGERCSGNAKTVTGSPAAGCGL